MAFSRASKLSRLRLATIAGASLLTALLVAPAALADIDFTLKYQDKGDAPDWDPDGRDLTWIVRAAARHWQSLYPGVRHDLTIRYRWENPYAGAIGLSPAETDVAWALTDRPYGEIGGANTFTIRFHTHNCPSDGDHQEIDWFVDRDPEDHSEFSITPAVVGSTSSGPYFNGSPDQFLEVGYCGEARFEDMAGTDLFTVALHEIGHALGLGFRNESDTRADGDYDVPSTLPMGGFGVMAYLKPDSGKVDKGHLAISTALMGPSLVAGTRRLPTATDILAIASINGWTKVRLPRTFTGSAPGSAMDWSDASTWDPELPALSRGAMIMQMGNPSVEMSSPGQAADLFLDIQGELLVDDQNLQVARNATLMPSSTLQVTAGSLQAKHIFHDGDSIGVSGDGSLNVYDGLYVGSGSLVYLYGGLAGPAKLRASAAVIQLENASLDAYTADAQVGYLYSLGSSTVISGGATNFHSIRVLRNDGVIRPQNGDLSFNFAAAPDLSFDLDGEPEDRAGGGSVEHGGVDARSGSAFFSGGPTDEFNGKIVIGYDRQVSLAGEIVIGALGTAWLVDGLAQLAASHIDVAGGEIHVDGTCGDYAYLIGGQTWRDGGTVLVGSLAMLKVNGDSAYRGGTISTGGGRIVQNGDVTVADGRESIVGVQHYDWNGDAPDGNDITIAKDSTLHIMSDVGDPFVGTITIEDGGLLIVDADWELDGELHLYGGTVEGGKLTNCGTVKGWGTVATTFVNMGTVDHIGSGIVITK